MAADDLDLGATLKGFSPGQRVFNRYTLQRLLGRGGMGVVWLVRDEELGRDSAIKFLPEVVATDRAAIADMKREVRRAIDLAHPHIIKTHDFITDGRTAGVSMEYIPGGTLGAARLDEPGQVFGVDRLGPWLRQLCAALEYAHETGEVVHRDLKPSNLMIDARGRLKVVDFGIAASLSESVSRVSKQMGSSGTPVYMSPQQMMGEPPAVTDDIYAVGASLMELLTGKPPFHAGNIMMQVQGKVAPLVNERRAQAGLPPIPPAWERAIAACLAKNPAERPQTAAALARLVEEAPAPITAPPKAEPAAPAPAVAVAPAPVPASPGPAASPLRWFLAALAGAVVPAATTAWLMRSADDNGEFYFNAPEALTDAILGPPFHFCYWVLSFLSAMLVLRALRVRRPALLATLLGLAGAALGGGVCLVFANVLPGWVIGVMAGAGIVGAMIAGVILAWEPKRTDPAQIAPARRWMLAPLAAAVVPAMTTALLMRFEQSGGYLNAPELLRGSFPGPILLFAAWALAFLPVVAMLQELRLRSLKLSVIVFGLVGAGAAGGGAGLLSEYDLPLWLTVAAAGAGALGAVVSMLLLHWLAFGVESGGQPVPRSRVLLALLGGGLAVYFVGEQLPASVREFNEARWAAENAAWEAQQAEERKLAEARAEQERIRQREQRLAQSGVVVAEAFRLVLDRAPTAQERERYQVKLADQPGMNAAALRKELREAAATRTGALVRVPEEFSTIQAAVEAAAPGNVIRVAAGLYKEGIAINKPVSLIGADAASVIVEVGVDRLGLYVEKAKVTVRGFTFRQVGKTEADSRYSLVGLSDGAEVVFENNIVRSANGHGLFTRGAGRKLVRNNLIEGARWAGINVYAKSDVEIVDNTVQRCEQAGISITEPVASARVAGNRIRNNKRNGIWLGQGDNVVLEHNEVTANGTEGVLYGGIGVGAGQPRLAGNTAQGNIGTGIWWNNEKAKPRIGAGNLSDGQALPETP